MVNGSGRINPRCALLKHVQFLIHIRHNLIVAIQLLVAYPAYATADNVIEMNKVAI
jgi:hypothetical protein